MAPKRLTRQERKAQTRDRLLDAAEQVLVRQGFHAASVEDIAEEAGYTVGAVYSNFASKEDLFIALVEDCTEKRLNETRQAFEGAELSPQARVETASRNLIDHMLKDQSLWLLFMEFWSTAVRDPKLRARFTRYSEAFIDAFAKLVSTQLDALGLRPHLASREIAVALISLADGLMIGRTINPKRYSDEFYEGIFRRFMFGLIAPLDEAQMISIVEDAANAHTAEVG